MARGSGLVELINGTDGSVVASIPPAAAASTSKGGSSGRPSASDGGSRINGLAFRNVEKEGAEGRLVWC